MLVRVRRTPSPPPNAGESARVSPPRDAECAAATPTLGKEGEEEEEEEEEEKMQTTVTNSTTRTRDNTNYQDLLKSEGKALGEKVRSFLRGRGVKTETDSSLSIDQYMRHVWRFLRYCEELNPNEERNSYYISRQMFENYLRWYEKKIGRSQNEYRHVGVALGHVVRCFLELDEKKSLEQGESGNGDEREMYFRSSAGLSREEAISIAAKAGKDVQANAGFWHNGQGKSFLSEKKMDANLGKMKARNDGVTPTTRGTAVNAIIEEDALYSAANVGMDRFLDAKDESGVSNESLRCSRLTSSQFMGRPSEGLHYRLSGMTVRKPQHAHNPNRSLVEFRIIATEHKGNTSMTKSSGQNIERPVERVAVRHVSLNMCPIGWMARDAHVQHVCFGRVIDFRKRELVKDKDGNDVTKVSWRTERFFGAGATFKRTDIALRQKNRQTALERREKTVPAREYNPLFAGNNEIREQQYRNKTYLRATRATLAMERTEDQASKEAIKKMGNWSGTSGNVFEDNYLFALPLKALIAAAGGSSRSDGAVAYTLEGNRDSLVVDEALIACFADGLVLNAESAYDDMAKNGWPSAKAGVRGEEDEDLYHFKKAIRVYARVFWQDSATLFVTREGAKDTYFIDRCVLQVLANNTQATNAWERLVGEARERKKSANTIAEVCRNDSAEARSVTEVVASGVSEIARICAQGLEESNTNLQQGKRERENFFLSIVHLATQQLDPQTREGVQKALNSNKGGYSTSLAPPSPKRAKDSTPPPENTVTLLSRERERVHLSTTIEDFRANYDNDVICEWGQARRQELQKDANRKEEYNKHMGLLRKYKSNAKKEFEALRLALDGADATEFNQRLLQKVAPGKSFDRIEDAEVKKLIAKEFARVARKLKEKRAEISETPQVDEAKSILRRTLEEEWPALSATPASGDAEMDG